MISDFILAISWLVSFSVLERQVSNFFRFVIENVVEDVEISISPVLTGSIQSGKWHENEGDSTQALRQTFGLGKLALKFNPPPV